MNTTLQNASQLRKNGDYKQAVSLYDTLWDSQSDSWNEWDGWSYAYSLVKTFQYQKALDICRHFYRRNKSFEILNNLYAQCIYYTQFMGEKQPALDILRKATQAMLDLSPYSSKYSFTPKAIFKLNKLLMSQMNIDWAEIEFWLLKMDPDLLDDQPFKMVYSTGKEVELASSLEEWYAGMIKAQAGLNRPEKLIEYLDAAEKRKIKWHYNNDLWFDRKRAFAYHELGQSEKAENILRKIVLQKKDWFLLYDLARVVSNQEEALKLMCQAARSRSKPEMKLKLFYSLYEQLKDRELYQEEAVKHLCLIAAIREEKGWSPLIEVEKIIKESSINTDKLGSSSAIIRELEPVWNKIAGVKKIERKNGVVSKVFPHGGAGFINSEGKSYYFTMNHSEKKVAEKSKVSFEIRDSFDKKKGKPTQMAVKIRAL